MARRVEGVCGGGCAGLWCGMQCADLEVVTVGKSQFIFFVTVLCLKHSVSAQMHVFWL